MPGQARFPEPPFDLAPLPDETLFSWCSRYHRLAANGLDRATCLQLFGHPWIGSAHDFPARIDALVARSNGTLGAAEQVIRERTLLPFYLPFRLPPLGQQAVTALRGEGIRHLKYRLGLLTSGLGAAHPLKACPACMRRDLGDLGWGYWHRSHQLPGVWLCPTHHIPLRVSHLKLEQVARFAWVLPVLAHCSPVACLEGHAKTATRDDWLSRLGNLSCLLMDCRAGDFADPVRIGEAVRRRMKEMGMAYPSGRIHWQAVAPWLNRLASNLASLPGLNQQADSTLLQTQLTRLLGARALTHPLRYLIWIATWFDDLKDFQQEYGRATTGAAKVAGTNSGKGPRRPAIELDQAQAQALLAVLQGKISVTAAAKQSGVSYATMAAWASRGAFEPPRRPKKLEDLSRGLAVRMLYEGANKEEIAHACQVSVVTVTRILRTVPGLQEQWHHIRHERRRTAAREAWKSVSGLHAYLGVKVLRRLEPAAYAWLYRNDGEWLRASLDTVTRVLSSNHATIRIQREDTRMADALRGVVLALRQAAVPLSLTELKRALPALGKAIRYPERWPLTVKALASIASVSGSCYPLWDGGAE